VPYNAGIYKASHNSYDRNESLAEQIDAYNVWQLEFDIYDFNGEFRVNHNCDPVVGVECRYPRLPLGQDGSGNPYAESKVYFDLCGPERQRTRWVSVQLGIANQGTVEEQFRKRRRQ